MRMSSDAALQSLPVVDDGSERSYYSISEVAALVGVSRVSIWRWISSGRLPATRLGHRTVRVHRADLEMLIQPASRAARATGAQVVRRTDGAARGADWLKVAGPHEHSVLFYDAERYLLDGIVDFLRPALNTGDRAVVVATPEHRAHIDECLSEVGVDMCAARADGRFVEADAAQTLERFMVGGEPDPMRFADVVSGLVGPAVTGSRKSRVFGEMVALLVGQGNPEGALRLEALWNLMQRKHSFMLLCAYPMQHLGGEALAAVVAELCDTHGTLLPAESYTPGANTDERMREVVALQQKAASLERALAAERAAHTKAAAALHAREEFLSIAAHELRTPIAVLGTQAQLSLRRLERTGQLEPERVVQAFRTVSGQADKLARLINQLLDISRVDAGKLELELDAADLAQLVSEQVRATQSLTDRHTISLNAPESLVCTVDALRLEQLLNNLLDNAIKYSPDGGEVQVSLRSLDTGRIELAVRDHGLGIPRSKRERIFERFYQAHENGYRSGMGLGLYVCRRIVELHGGEIRAEFPSDGGTLICVQLPFNAP